MYYVTDALMYISQNTANARGGKALMERFFDVLKKKPEETRTAQDIINNFKKKLGG